MRSVLGLLHLTRFSPSVLAVTGATAIVATTLFGGATMATLSRTNAAPTDLFKVATVGIESRTTDKDGVAVANKNTSVFADTAMAADVFTFDNVVPGDQWMRVVTLTNAGTVDADFSFRADASDNAGGALVNGVTTGSGRSFTLEVDECADATCSGTPNKVYPAGTNLGVLTTDTADATSFVALTNTGVKVKPGDPVYLKVTLSYPDYTDWGAHTPDVTADVTPGFAVQGKSAWINFTWKAIQSATDKNTAR
jgi:hypothetical protein